MKDVRKKEQMETRQKEIKELKQGRKRMNGRNKKKKLRKDGGKERKDK